MKKTILIMLLFSMLLLSVTLVYAHGDFNETKQLIDSDISCDKLTDEQLEVIGDYYMEQMHPGEAHEMMHKMMGGEDSETTKLMHINMPESIYCGETNQEMMGMMNMMSSNNSEMMNMMVNDRNMMSFGGMMNEGMMGGNMMTGRGMMGNTYYQNPQNNFIGFQIFYYVLLTLVTAILVLIILLLINKLKKQGGNNKHGK